MFKPDISEAVIMPDQRVFADFKEYFRLAIPSTVMVTLDWWIGEFMVLISGWLSVDEQAATVVMM